MSDEEKSIWDETPGMAPEDFKFPEQKVPDQDALYPMGFYEGIVGRIKPFYAGADGKKASSADQGARFLSIQQELWIVSVQYVEDEKLVVTPRITVENGKVTFKDNRHHGIKIIEFFPTEINPKFDKMSWRTKAFYDTFPNVIIGEKGNKKIVWEAVKAHYGTQVSFNVVYNEAKPKEGMPTSVKKFRNTTNVEIFLKKKYDAEIMAQIERMYEEYRIEELRNKNTGTAEPNTKVDDLQFP